MERIGQRPRIPRIAYLAVAALLVLIFARSICELILDYNWWSEMGQVSTWIRMNEYRYLPGLAAWVLVWVILLVAHTMGLKYAGISRSMFPMYSRIAMAALALLALILATASVDGWQIARYIGAS